MTTIMDDHNPDLPWGAALVPDWWTEVTPHHVLALDEMDHERRQEAARLAAMRAEWAKSPTGSVEAEAAVQSGELLMDTASGPYSSLPGFQGSDGIHDASFIGPGHVQWSITSEGLFYTQDDPNVRYTASQMIESGHLPPGMDDYFVPGWNDPDHRMRPRTPGSDTRVYARTEASAWERPDWLQKKLRSTDQGIALRHGVDGRAVSPSPRRRFPNTDDNNFSGAAEDYLPRPVPGPTTPSREVVAPAAGGAKPAWKQRQEAMAAAHKKSPTADANATSSYSTPPKSGSGDGVPEWKRKHDEFAKKHGAPMVLEAQGSKPASLSPWMNNKANQQPPPTASPPPAEEGAARAVPAWKKKTQPANAPVTTTSTTNNSVPSWKKPHVPPETTKTTTTTTTVPSWKKKQEDAAAATAASASASAANDDPPPAAAVSTKLNLKPKAPVPASLQSVVSAAPPLSSSTPQPPQPDDTARVSQALVLKLMNLGDDATRARELRNHIAPVAENNHTVIVPPSELLKAIAHHAQRCKSTTSTTTDQSSPSPLDALRQVAIIARLVILKLYGTGSPELSQFEDGLRPAFS